MYFVGNPKEELDSTQIVLSNLRCPTLSDYRWYKDVFLTHILKRADCNASFWKERFIAGLPKLFGERIHQKLKEATGLNEINFEIITYGQLFAFIKKEGLCLCSELKIQSKYESEKSKFKKEVGTFCEAFGWG